MGAARRSPTFALLIAAAASFAPAVLAQPEVAPSDPAGARPTSQPDTAIDAPDTVEVQPVARDDEIEARLKRIMSATGWFESIDVSVDEGVVFLRGRTEQERYAKWAGDLARSTRDVTATVNEIEVTQPSPWNFAPAASGLSDLWTNSVYWFPFVVLASVILLVTYFAATLTTRGLRPLLKRRIPVALLREVIARAVGVLVFVLGLYVVLRICGLTRLALTVMGGTGLLGLVIGIAFRDITENFLASVLLSVQSPFRVGDLVDIDGQVGYVQQLNVRTTVLMSLTGNHIQLPNALVYKSVIRNYSSNPNRREEFTVGIGYEVPIARAQAIALEVLEGHEAVLKTPEPWVLVESLGAATVNLRIYFWIDGSRFSWLKVRSSIIRLVKRAFQDNGVTMPDEVREVIFPQGVPVVGFEETTQDAPRAAAATPPDAPAEELKTEAEAGLHTEAQQLQEQAAKARQPEEGENLLKS